MSFLLFPLEDKIAPRYLYDLQYLIHVKTVSKSLTKFPPTQDILFLMYLWLGYIFGISLAAVHSGALTIQISGPFDIDFTNTIHLQVGLHNTVSHPLLRAI